MKITFIDQAYQLNGQCTLAVFNAKVDFVSVFEQSNDHRIGEIFFFGVDSDGISSASRSRSVLRAVPNPRSVVDETVAKEFEAAPH